MSPKTRLTPSATLACLLPLSNPLERLAVVTLRMSASTMGDIRALHHRSAQPCGT